PVERVDDPDVPPPAGFRLATGADVAGRVDAMVDRSGGGQHLGGLLYGPAFDQSRGIEGAPGVGPRVEVAAGLDPELLAAFEDPTDIGAGFGRGQLAPADPADLAVGAVGAERCVDPVQPGEYVLDD